MRGVFGSEVLSILLLLAPSSVSCKLEGGAIPVALSLVGVAFMGLEGSGEGYISVSLKPDNLLTGETPPKGQRSHTTSLDQYYTQYLLS